MHRQCLSVTIRRMRDEKTADRCRNRGHRYMEKKEFRCDDIAARLNSIIKAITPDELAMLGLPADYEAEFLRRKKHLFDVNRNFE